MSVRINDTDMGSPAYPHGTERGYRNGCKGDTCPATPTCADVGRKKYKQRRLRQAGALPPADTSRVPAAQVQAHVRALREEVPGVTWNTIADIAGLPGATVRLAASGKHERVSRAVARSIMAVTPEQAKESATDVPVTPKMIQLVRSMQAQGWSLVWQSQRVGRSRTWANKLTSGSIKAISHDTARRLEALAASLETKTNPDRRTQNYAKNAGWHPLAAYDDDGALIPGAVRDEEMEDRKEHRTRQAERRIIAVRGLLAGRSSKLIAADIGVDSAIVDRYRIEVGLRVNRHGELRPEYAGRAREVRAVMADHDGRCLDAWETVRFRLGMMLLDRYNWDTPDMLHAPDLSADADEQVAA